MKYNHCNEKGMRFESATVPAAVKPDRSYDDGFMKYLPLSRFIGMGRLHKTGISQKTCHTNLIFTAFGNKSAESFIDSPLIFPCQLRILNERVEYKIVLRHIR
jgi:hypothetical protein